MEGSQLAKILQVFSQCLRQTQMWHKSMSGWHTKPIWMEEEWMTSHIAGSCGLALGKTQSPFIMFQDHHAPIAALHVQISKKDWPLHIIGGCHHLDKVRKDIPQHFCHAFSWHDISVFFFIDREVDDLAQMYLM
jgi:hypothetical protein